MIAVKKTQKNCREVRVIGASGRKTLLTSREMLSVTRHPITWVYFVLLIAMMTAVDPLKHRPPLDIVQSGFVWLSCFLLVWVLYQFTFLGLFRLSEKYNYTIFIPIIGFIVTPFGLVAVVYIASMLSGGDFLLQDYWRSLPLFLFVGFLMEVMYDLFVCPNIERKLGIQGATDQSNITPVSQASIITIAGTVFCASHIFSISSQDHYIEVNARGENVLLRARLADVVWQLSQYDGIIPHRSHWVPRSSVAGLGGVSAAKYLKLTDGREIPIARGRLQSVQKWLEK